MSIQLKAKFAPQLNLAAQQHDIAFLQELHLVNDGERDYSDLQVELSADPHLLQPCTWKIDRLPAGESIFIPDRQIVLNGQLLLELREALRGRVRLRTTFQENVLAELTQEIELLARDEWGGWGSSPELLAAFVTPNDPAIGRFIKRAIEVLTQWQLQSELEGYRSQSWKRVLEQISALWAAVYSFKISYAYPPANFEKTGQRVRFPSRIYEERLSTCLDTTLLFCALCEQIGLHSTILLQQGHAFVGVWMSERAGSTQIFQDDLIWIRKRMDLKELVFWETTLVHQQPFVKFRQAQQAAIEVLQDTHAQEFVGMIDLRQARLERIHPLDFARERTQHSEVARSVDIPEGSIDEPEAPNEVIQVNTGKATSPIDLWQAKLLDLTLRNPLLNAKDNSLLSLIAPEPGKLEDLLADGKEFQILPAPQFQAVAGRDERLSRRRGEEDFQKEQAREGLSKGRLYTRKNEGDLQKQLVTLFRKSRADQEEGGANTLFLALGFLHWQRDDYPDRIFRAPLILVPVELKRRSAQSGFRLRLHDEDTRFNSTLLEMLRCDFDIEIEGLHGELPTDHSGVDVDGIWNYLRHKLLDVPKMEVNTDVGLGTFSFAKYLMWKDLVDRTEQLRENDVVRKLLDQQTPAGGWPLPRDSKLLDEQIHPQELFTPLEADSSQIAAIVSSVEGRNMVMIGPPGTGKSQTIANMIAHNLAHGKTVLFVAEKAAALNVVYRRLQQIGLGDLCLELHSNKARKTEVLEQLRKSVELESMVDELTDWEQTSRELQQQRDRLNKYAQRLHQQHRNGLTIRQALGWVTVFPKLGELNFPWASADAHTEEDWQQLQEQVKELGVLLAEIGDPHQHPLSWVSATDWSFGWQQKLLRSAQLLKMHLSRLRETLQKLESHLGLPLQQLPMQQLPALKDLCANLSRLPMQPLAFAFRARAPEVLELTHQALSQLNQFNQLRRELSCEYTAETFQEIPLVDCKQWWQKSSNTWWPNSVILRRRVRSRLKKLGGAQGDMLPEKDLPLLEKLQNLESQLENKKLLQEEVPGWEGKQSDSEQIGILVDSAERLRSSSAAISTNTDDLLQWREKLRQLTGDHRELLTVGQLPNVIEEFQVELQEFQQEWVNLQELALVDSEQNRLQKIEHFGEIEQFLQILESNTTNLKVWCQWQFQREAAIGAGLGPFIDALETSAFPTKNLLTVFKVAYCRWWVTKKLDADDVLRSFISALHEQRIKDFQQLDRKQRELTAQAVKARFHERQQQQDESQSSQNELGMLQRELAKNRRHKPLRQLVQELPEMLPRLKPCLLMSPLSIAQYLPAGHQPFDVVIFDEASQITTWDAIGALARGKRVVVVGDPKQLPPTNFFGRQDNDDEAEDIALESVLDEMLGAGVPQIHLKWHYRSKYENLIAFSNQRYYGGELITFPSPTTKDSSVRLQMVKGHYDRGGSQTNLAEARAISNEIVNRLQGALSGNLVPSTIGVVTFNSKQQTLIEDHLEQKRRQHPEIEPFFSEIEEPVMVKNLENVQGDQRDVILFSVTYGPDEAGKVTMNFGPLNKEGGERRLNVAITRSQQEMVVFSTLHPSQIDLGRTSALGVRDLKHFLEFAERGPQALAAADLGSVGDFDSPFEKAVSMRLQNRGWNVRSQIGVSGFRIDLGVVHPDAPGDFLAGIECDGATYHRSATARDRDIVREGILTRLGWKIIRLWSTDFFHDPQGSIEKLHKKLEALLDESRKESQNKPAAIPNEELSQPSASEPDESSSEEVTQSEPSLPDNQANTVPENIPSTVEQTSLFQASQQLATTSFIKEYETYDVSSFPYPLDKDLFYQSEYDQNLAKFIREIVRAEGPISENLLKRRVREAHGFAQGGNRMSERIYNLARRSKLHISKEGDLRFYWLTRGNAENQEICRLAKIGEPERDVDDIAKEELFILIRNTQIEGDALQVVAHRLGIARVTQRVRSRLEPIIRECLSAAI